MSTVEEDNLEENREEKLDWTDSQKNVYENIEGSQQVIACAGSGKTVTMARRIAEMVSEGVDRNEIVAFTFTENAADKLKKDIKEQMEIVNPEDSYLEDMFVGTIHSFCLNEILKEYQEKYTTYDVLDDNEIAAFLLKEYWNLGIQNITNYNSDQIDSLDHFLEDVSTVHRETILEDLKNSTNTTAQEFLDCYKEFNDKMDELHFLDYSSILYRTYTFLKNKDNNILSKVKNEWKYFIVDEYQDINPIQEKIIKLLTEPENDICVVGDDDQSIYQWRGARLTNFLTFTGRYDAGEPERLETNYRSSKAITEIARDFIRNNEERMEKEMESSENIKSELGDVYALEKQTKQEEIEWVCNKIDSLLGTVYVKDGEEKTITKGDIALLFRRKSDMEPFISAFEDRGLNYTVKGRETIFSRPETEFVRRAFAYIADGATSKKENGEVIERDVEIEFELEEVEDQDTEVRSVRKSDLVEIIRKSDKLRKRESEILEGVNEKKRWFSNPDKETRRIFPQEEFYEILRIMQIPDENEEDYEELMYDLGRISELLKDFEKVYELVFPDQIADLINFIEWANENSRVEMDDPTRIDALKISTIHSIKGTEYPVVFMPNLNTNGFPRSSSPPPWEQYENYTAIPRNIFNVNNYSQEEEYYRRLFYVALTRTRKFLFLTSARDCPNLKNERNPSPYLEEVLETDNPYIIEEDTPDLTPRKEGEPIDKARDYVYPTSFSDICYYLKCPFDYKLRFIYGFKPSINQGFDYGYSIHNVLRNLYEDFELDTTRIEPTPAEIESKVENPDLFYLRYTREEPEENLKNKAKEILKNYVEENREEITNLTYLAEEPFELLIPIEDEGNALVSGTIDLIKKEDPITGEVKEIDIVEFKVWKKRDDDKLHSEYTIKQRNAKFQTRLYALGSKSRLDKEPVRGMIYELTEGEKTEVPFEDRLLEQAKISIKQSVSEIMSRNFDPPGEREAKCSHCDYKQICPYMVN